MMPNMEQAAPPSMVTRAMAICLRDNAVKTDDDAKVIQALLAAGFTSREIADLTADAVRLMRAL